MKRLLLLVSLVAGGAGVLFAASADTELKDIEHQWIDSYVKGDADFLKNIEADNYSLVEPDGTIATKAEDIEGVTGKTFVCKSATMSDIKVRMLGDNYACVTGLVKMTATDHGKDVSGDYRGVDVFEKKGGKWQAIFSQVTKVAKEKE
jgi:ketosteroid isomerase-like protein